MHVDLWPNEALIYVMHAYIRQANTWPQSKNIDHLPQSGWLIYQSHTLKSHRLNLHMTQWHRLNSNLSGIVNTRTWLSCIG